ncbi:protein abrupt-like isoform X1 [Danaus plexippus]|uniref:protein abrupt-like isoform X1 n=2 Tax=Danaus plexippus TaxID=13037 RepID=UPI002AAFAEDF|nr:protein abrupt-like isoform X1 [Danaus plexippus]
MTNTESQFSLSWDDHVANICNGLSLLQQNGEFVDMTLAADGHLVKVHQVIMALSSPFLKDLISSAECPHPVIFLNKISHTTLSALLEYIYTGEVLVAIEDLNELIDAAKELHIKGLQEMNLADALSVEEGKTNEEYFTQIECLDGNQDIYLELPNQESNQQAMDDGSCSFIVSDIRSVDDVDQLYVVPLEKKDDPELIEKIKKGHIMGKVDAEACLKTLQYTISNQGSLQMILNRFIYYLKHSNRDKSRQWRCVDYLNHCKCPAYVVTKEDVVVQRISSHNHPFHDRKILKKVKTGSVFSAFNEAEIEGNNRKALEDTNSD